MISYIRLTHWCNDFAKIPHLEKSRGFKTSARWDGLSPSVSCKGWCLGAGEEYENGDLCHVVRCNKHLRISLRWQMELIAGDFLWASAEHKRLHVVALPISCDSGWRSKHDFCLLVVLFLANKRNNCGQQRVWLFFSVMREFSRFFAHSSGLHRDVSRKRECLLSSVLIHSQATKIFIWHSLQEMCSLTYTRARRYIEYNEIYTHTRTHTHLWFFIYTFMWLWTFCH